MADDTKTSNSSDNQHETADATRRDQIAVRKRITNRGRIAQLAADVLLVTAPSHGGRLVYFELDDDYNAREVAVLAITPANMARILGRTLDQHTATEVAEKVRCIDKLARQRDDFHRLEEREALRSAGELDEHLAANGYLDRTGNGELTLALGGQR